MASGTGADKNEGCSVNLQTAHTKAAAEKQIPDQKVSKSKKSRRGGEMDGGTWPPTHDPGAGESSRVRAARDDHQHPPGSGRYRSIPHPRRRQQHRHNGPRHPRDQQGSAQDEATVGDATVDTRGSESVPDKNKTAVLRSGQSKEVKGDISGEKADYGAGVERNHGRRNRNRPRARKRPGGGDGVGGHRHEFKQERDSKVEADGSKEANSDFSDRPRYGRGKGGGGRRQGRSDRESWRREPRQRDDDRPRYYKDRDRRAFERREERSTENKSHDCDSSDHHDRGAFERRREAGNKSHDRDSSERPDYFEQNISPGDQDTTGKGTQVSDAGRDASSVNTAGELRAPTPDDIVERVSKPRHSKQKGYDYTKPRGDNRDFSRSKYKGHSHHHPKLGRKDFTPTVQSDELSQQLTAETYECMVCCDCVKERDQIWSCQNCYHIFHLRCIKKWASAPTFTSTEDESNCEGWRCPSCRNLSKYVPTLYRCYCGKVVNPRLRSRGELSVPHSCGELCKKKLATTPESSCRHQCQLPCHPGPCPPCPVMVTRTCPCGRKQHQVRCSKTGDLPSCEAVCAKTLACGRHDCDSICHPGPCSTCSVTMTMTCHCGRTQQTVLCGETKELEFSCQQVCNRELDCGNHLCERLCHAGPCLSCSLLPANVTHCPCGASTVDSLLSEENQRTSCLDPVPTCDSICGKRLPCSSDDTVHSCESLCHLGECPPCNKSTMVTCRCGRNSIEKPCADLGKEGEFVCSHVCNKKKSCGRHRCNVRCCKDSEHVCELLCGKKLQCGQHTCQETCHSGYCQPCWEYSYDELTCHCGAEVIYPPIPCGTRPPSCSNPCARIHSCSHPVNHNCHSDEACPKCTFLTEKMCMGGHEMRRNIPCHLADVSCGSACGKTLPCGMHRCKRTCHRDTCLSNTLDGCQQPCTSPRKYCGHECGNPCHVGRPCPDTPCRTAIVVKCKCGRKSEKMLCLACGSGAMHQTFQKLFSKDLGARIRELQSGHSVSISDVTVSTEGRARFLDCDEVCAQEERNRKLAAALEIDNPNISPSEDGLQYSSFLLEQAREDIAFVSSVEEALRNLAESALKGSTNQSRTHHFRPMKNTQRKVIHELSLHYGCDTTSFDSEPVRNVMASVNKIKAKIPVLSLTKIAEKDKPRVTPAPVSVSAVRGQRSDEGGVKTLVQSAGNKESCNAPDYFYDDISCD